MQNLILSLVYQSDNENDIFLGGHLGDKTWKENDKQIYRSNFILPCNTDTSLYMI